MSWHMINTGLRPGSFNMALDEKLAFELRDGTGSSTVRFYGWQPYAVSIGFNQHVEEFDQTLLDSKGIDLVRRPTGGKAILHAHELTYSVVTRCDEMSPREIYNHINKALLRGLHHLGIEARLSGRDDPLPRLYQEPSSIPCFASSTRYEIQYSDKKLIGSAQRRYQNIVLQHGSLLLGIEHRQIVEFLSPELQHLRAAMERDLHERTIEAGTILGRTVTFDEAVACLARGFEEAWDISFVEAMIPHEATIRRQQSPAVFNELSLTP